MSTGAIIAIVAGAVILLVLFAVVLPRLRGRRHERQLEARRGELASRHREEARARAAESEAKRAEAEAELHEARADLHDRGLADEELDGTRDANGRTGVDATREDRPQRA
jgi:F0F1-type ATP synthase membrane subunit b/b'